MANQLLAVQALRALAATAVVLAHLMPFEAKYATGEVLFPRGFEYGQAGVDLFFVISGYIMAVTTFGRFGSAASGWGFLQRRALRIYPVYWVYLTLVCAVWLVAPRIMNAGASVPPDILASYTLLPHQNGHLLLVSWTLSFEMFFYLVFAALLATLRNGRLGLALAAWAGITIAGQLLFQPGRPQPYLNLIFNPLVLEFIAGAAVALLLPRLGLAQATRLGLGLGLAQATRLGLTQTARLGATLFLAGLLVAAIGIHVMLGQGGAFPENWPRVLVFGSAATLLLAGCVLLEPVLAGHLPAWLIALGDASYSIYLSHLLTIGVVGQFWRAGLAADHPLNHLLALATALLVSLLAGLLSYRLLEQPLMALLQGRRRRPVLVAGAG
ncbi:MAG: putative acyltransferase [Belnapia sp.]|nr:putative acyltransferase [Belnapia sp.]